MGNLVDKKFTWVIKNFNTLKSKIIFSDKFVVGGCKWNLSVWPKGDDEECPGYLCSYLESEALPCGWRRHVKFNLTLVNKLSETLSQKNEGQEWFSKGSLSWGFLDMILLTKLHERNSGFLVNGELTIIAEVDVVEVIGQSLKKRKQDNDGVWSNDLSNKNQLLKEVNGFLVLPWQAETVKRIFEKHPDMASEIRTNNQDLRTSYMNALVSLINMMCQSLQDLSTEDLSQAENALRYLKNSGFKVDWLELKLEEVKEKKIEEEIGEIRLQELEEELKDIKALLLKKEEELNDLKNKCSNIEALLKKEKAKVLAARVPPLTLDDVV